jgi:hypothetical protein
MTDLAPTFLAVADSALGLLREPAVASGWAEPSALERHTVGGLAVHLGTQIRYVVQAQATVKPPTALLDHYAQAPWIGAGLDSEANTGIRERGEAEAKRGHEALVTAVAEALAQLRETLPDAAGAQSVALPWTTLRLDDLLVTRLMELAVHSDDLAVSVALPTPELPGEATDLVLDLLTHLSVRRHGPTAVLRALSRTERAPETIAAF